MWAEQNLVSENIKVRFIPVKSVCLVFSGQSKVLEVFAQHSYFNFIAEGML